MSTWLTILAFLPIVIIGYLLWCVARPVFSPAVEAYRHRVPFEDFGEGPLSTKTFLLLFTSCLNALGAGFKLGTNFDARPMDHPTWYHSRAAFYVFNFTIDTIILYAYFVFRIDKIFWVPNGAKGPGEYNPRPNAVRPNVARPNPARPRNEEQPQPAGEGIPLEDFGEGQDGHQPVRAADRDAEREAENQPAVPAPDAPGTPKPPEHVLSSTFLAGSSTSVPQSSTSEGGAQALSSGIRPPPPSFTYSGANSTTGLLSNPAQPSSSSVNERGPGAATAGTVGNTGNNYATSGWTGPSHLREGEFSPSRGPTVRQADEEANKVE